VYKSEFDKLIAQNKKYDAYLFYGQSHFLVDYYASKISLLHGPKEDIEKIYFADYDFKYLKDKLLQSSLFSSNNIVLLKLDKKISKKECDELIEACNSNPDSVLIISCLGDAEFKTMEKSFSDKTNSVSVRMFALNPNEAVKMLEQKATSLKMNFDINALSHLFFMHKHDMSLCMNDLNKLAILKDKIDSNMVNTHCFGIGGVNFEDFLHDLVSTKDVSDDLFMLLEEGMNEIYLLNQITSFVQQLFMISSYARSFGQANPKEILGFIPPKNIWEKKSKLAISIKPQNFLEIFDFLTALELELKSGKIKNQDIFLQASLRKFQVLFR
jgi:DNA polymerase-3 subunit delta